MFRLLACRALCVALCLANPGVALAQSWDLAAGGTAIFHIELRRSGQTWQAVWTRPTHFLTDGDSFFELTGPAVSRKASAVQALGNAPDSDLELTFPDPQAPGQKGDVLHLHPLADGRATMGFVGMALAPFTLVRSTPAMRMGPWDSDAHYPVVTYRPTSAAMTALFDADQAARRQEHIDWSVLHPADDRRRLETQALLDSGALQSGADFFHAAFVFQHGHTPADFLKAHLLAMVAVARGRSDALWIASASLDRYLQNIHQPQVLGTQFAIIAGKAVQDPFDTALVSDAMRRALGVPVLADQAAQGKMFEQRDARARAKPAP